MLTLDLVIEKVRNQMNARGAKTLRSLGRVFATYDTDNNRKVDAQEFFVGLNESGCDLTKEETDCLLTHFDTDADGCVNFDEFVVLLRGKMNESRMAAVMSIFEKFDLDNSGAIDAAELKGQYACNSHPRVVSGEITEDEAFLEFLANFGDRNNDGKISKTEWCDYYSAVSASVDNDEHFCTLVSKAWGM